MDEGTREEIRLLLRHSHDDLETAELLLTAGKFRACISRSYLDIVRLDRRSKLT